MSRLAKRGIPVAAGVSVTLGNGEAVVAKEKRSVKVPIPEGVGVALETGTVKVSGDASSMVGLTWSLLANAVEGVVKPFTRDLELQGVGYQVSIDKGHVVLSVGFANKVRLAIPDGVTATCSDATHVQVSGSDRQVVGQFAANIRRVRPPEPYKGKGVRYVGEVVRRKAGKAFGAK